MILQGIVVRNYVVPVPGHHRIENQEMPYLNEESLCNFGSLSLHTYFQPFYVPFPFNAVMWATMMGLGTLHQIT